MVDKTPEAAKTRGEKEGAAKVKATEKRRALEAQHLKDLKQKLGEVGGQGGELIIGTDSYGNLTLFEQEIDKEGNPIRTEVFFWVQPDGVTFDKLYTSRVIAEAKKANKGNLEKLRTDLFNKGFLSETDYNTKNEAAFNNAILGAAKDYSLNQVQKYTVEGQTKFNSFNNWLGSLGEAGAGGSNMPVRDINLVDRDVIEALVRDIYKRETQMSPDEEFIKQETDRYMNQIKEGTLTKGVKKGGEYVRTTTKGFSQAQVEAELPGRIRKERPGATDAKTSLDFLAFLDNLGAQII